MKVHIQILKGGIRFSSDMAKASFIQKNEGKDAYIVIDDAPTAEKRRFFEGAIVPAIFYQLPKSGWQNFKECREAIKLEFLPGWTKNIAGERERYARATGELSNKKFGEFIETVLRWMEQQGMEQPDPEDYKYWRDSAPEVGEIYPQLERMIQAYNEQK